MDKMTMTLIVIALLIVGIVIYFAVKAKADAASAQAAEINAALAYKTAQTNNKAGVKDWLSTITATATAVAKIA